MDEEVECEEAEDDIADELEVSSAGVGGGAGVHAGEGGWL